MALQAAEKTLLQMRDRQSGADGAGGVVSRAGSPHGQWTPSAILTTNGAAQTIFAANADRQYGIVVQNNSGGDMWGRFGSAAAATAPSIKIAAGFTVTLDGIVDTRAFSLFGANGGAFTAWEA